MGLFYAILGSAAAGRTTTFFEGGFSVDNAVKVIETAGVTNLAAAPTAYRALMAARRQRCEGSPVNSLHKQRRRAA